MKITVMALVMVIAGALLLALILQGITNELNKGRPSNEQPPNPTA